MAALQHVLSSGLDMFSTISGVVTDVLGVHEHLHPAPHGGLSGASALILRLS